MRLIFCTKKSPKNEIDTPIYIITIRNIFINVFDKISLSDDRRRLSVLLVGSGNGGNFVANIIVNNNRQQVYSVISITSPNQL